MVGNMINLKLTFFVTISVRSFYIDYHNVGLILDVYRLPQLQLGIENSYARTHLFPGNIFLILLPLSKSRFLNFIRIVNCSHSAMISKRMSIDHIDANKVAMDKYLKGGFVQSVFSLSFFPQSRYYSD